MRFATALILSVSYSVTSIHAVTFDWATIGNPGNAPDATEFGAVHYVYRISKHEVTNAQYVEFLNSVDPSGANVHSLYVPGMTNNAEGGILRDLGASSGSKYAVKSDRGRNPVVYVSWYDAIRFVNWLHNGKGSGNTENGAYSLAGGTPTPPNVSPVKRSPGAIWWLPSEDEWYKAAYHKNDGATGNYWLYPTSTNNEPFSDQPPGAGAPSSSSVANFYKTDRVVNGYDDGYAVTGLESGNSDQNHISDVGAYAFSLSPYGTYDQGGNVMEWNEALIPGSRRGLLGGSWVGTHVGLMASNRANDLAVAKRGSIGFRVATIIPEPSTTLLACTCFLCFVLRSRPLCADSW